MQNRPTIHGVGRIYLMLGSACNFNCPHCIQHSYHPRIKKQVQPHVIRWLKDLAALRPAGMKPSIMFWGGEPLLYREAMRDVVEQLGDAFAYAMVSNGGLLTDKDVEWINAHGISYVYSNDGVNTDVVRDENLFEKPEFVERFNRIKRKGVCGVFHAHNQDLYKYWEYVRSKAPDADVFLEPLICSSNVPRSYSQYDFKALAEMYARIKEDFGKAVFGPEFSGSDAYSYIEGRMMWLKRELGETLFPVCGSGRGALNIDTAGKVYPCHNCTDPIGSVLEDYDTLYAKTAKYHHEHLSAIAEARKCHECEAFAYCGAGCPFEEPIPERPATCELKRLEFKTACDCLVAFKNFLEESDKDD